MALLECIYEEDQAALMFDIAFQQLEKAASDKDITEAIGGVIAAVAGVQKFKEGIPTCEAIDQSTFNFEQFDTCMDIAVHPLEHFQIIEEQVFINGFSIMKEINSAVEAYKRQDYHQFGLDLGQMLQLGTGPVRKITPRIPMVPAIENREFIAETAQGFLEAT